MTAQRANLITLVVAVIVSLLAAEGILRLFPVLSFRLIDGGFFSVVNRFEFHPRLGYTNRRDFEQTYTYMGDDCTDKNVELSYNSLGVRDEEVDEESSLPLVVFLGDSFTEAMHHDREETYPRRVAAPLQGRARVANFGVHNYDCSNYYNMAMLARDEYAPDIAFVGLYIGNDVMPYGRGGYRPSIPARRFQASLSGASYLYAWVDRAVDVASRGRWGAGAGQGGSGDADEDPILEQLSRGFTSAMYADLDEPACTDEKLEPIAKAYVNQRRGLGKTRLYSNPWQTYLLVQRTVMVLRDMRDDLVDTKLHVLLFPERLQVKDREWQWLSQSLPGKYVHRTLVQEKLAAALTTAEIPFTDMLPYLDETCYLRFDGHFSAEGNRKVGEVVVSVLATQYGL